MSAPGLPGRLLLSWRALPHPPCWRELFGRDAPLHLEIGFGDGRFTAAWARAHPEDSMVGLEVSGTSVLRALRRFRREGVENVRILKAPAEIAVRQLFAPGSLHSITVNFPDPWPKERHLDHRLLRVPFFLLAATRLVPGGEIRLASDHAPYVTFAREQGLASGVARLIEREAPAQVFETKYALKWREQGKPLFYQVFALDGHSAPPVAPLQRSDVMPHALLEGPWPTVAGFEKLVVAAPEGHVIVHEAARAFGEGERWLFRVTTDEPELVQQLLVVAQRRVSGEVIVRLEGFGDPMITATVRAAIGAVTDWFSEQGAMQVRARNY
jgi:tRNA (guanine-N7-)-methyltransferase